jgi:hypothetical protein
VEPGKDERIERLKVQIETEQDPEQLARLIDELATLLDDEPDPPADPA